MFKIVLAKQAVKDAKKLEKSDLKEKVLELLSIIEKDPLSYPPHYEFLKGIGPNILSRRINKQHRLVYQILPDEKIIKILRMWTHYE